MNPATPNVIDLFDALKRSLEKPRETMPTKPTETKRQSPDRFAQAGRVARRLADLDAQEVKALAEAPTDISKRYQAKRDAVLDGVAADVRELVERMRRSDEDAPVSE